MLVSLTKALQATTNPPIETSLAAFYFIYNSNIIKLIKLRLNKQT